MHLSNGTEMIKEIVVINKELLDILACPACKLSVKLKEDRLICQQCKIAFLIKDDIPVMIKEQAVSID